jgi:hypothetical protein
VARVHRVPAETGVAVAGEGDGGRSGVGGADALDAPQATEFGGDGPRDGRLRAEEIDPGAPVVADRVRVAAGTLAPWTHRTGVPALAAMPAAGMASSGRSAEATITERLGRPDAAADRRSIARACSA